MFKWERRDSPSFPKNGKEGLSLFCRIQEEIMQNNYIFPFLWMRGEPEEIIREEMARIAECGIGAVCVEARPHDDFCGPGWWHDMDIVLDEAKKRGMKVWILDDKHFPTGYAAGLIEEKYPERKKWYIGDTVADLFGSARRRTLRIDRMMKPVIGYWQLGTPADYAEQAGNRLIGVVALRFASGNTFAEEAIDLTDKVKDGMASFTLPEGQWRVHVLYRTRTDGGNSSYINMLDKVSAHTQIEGVYESHYQHYKEEFGKTIAGFFSDEPALGNTAAVDFNTGLGRSDLRYPWSDELEELLARRYPDGYRTLLPFLFADSEEKKLCPQLRYDYMDCVTRLYEKNFSRRIGDWCRDHGVEYIGHVVEDNGVHSRTGLGPGHWFRAMAGQDMAGIDSIGSQIIFGAPIQQRSGMGGSTLDGEFFHGILGKLGASSGHLDPLKKGRTMCELFGAYGWNFGVRDMKYLLDHLLCRGVNHLVPHAFSMAEYPDIDCPPHFYARGNNPQFPWFAELMKYANRMCGKLNGGKHIASVAVLYDGEADWTGNHMPMQKAGMILQQNQIEFDVVCLDMLRDLSSYNGLVEDGKLIINGVRFEVLIVPYAQNIPYTLARFISSAGSFPVIFLDGLPENVLGDECGSPADQDAAEWKTKAEAISLADLPAELRKRGISSVRTEPAFAGLSIYRYEKDGERIMAVNEDPDNGFHGNLLVPGGRTWIRYDGMKDRYFTAIQEPCGDETALRLDLEPGESVLLMASDEHAALKEGSLSACRKTVDLSENWHVQMFPAGGRGEPTAFEVPEAAFITDSYPTFSGVIRYEKEFELKSVPEAAFFTAEQVFDVMRLTVNDRDAGVCLTRPWRMEVTGLLKEGTNRITVEIANTPGRDQLNYPAPPFDFFHEALEPGGMAGKIALLVS